MYDIRLVQDFITTKVLATPYSEGRIVDFKIAPSSAGYYFVQLTYACETHLEPLLALLRNEPTFSLVGKVGYKENTLSFLADAELLKAQKKIYSKKTPNVSFLPVPSQDQVKNSITPLLKELGIAWYAADQKKGVILHEIKQHNLFKVILYGFSKSEVYELKRPLMTKIKKSFCIKNLEQENYFEIHF